MTPDNGWAEYQQMVLHRLGRMEGQLKDVENRLRNLEGKFWVLHTKAGVAGGVAGLVGGIMVRWLFGNV